MACSRLAAPIAMVMPKVGPSPAQASWVSTGTLRSRKITHMRKVRPFPASHVKVRVPNSATAQTGQNPRRFNSANMFDLHI